MLIKLLGQALMGLAIFLAETGAASAGSFSVTPLRATLSVSQSVGMLTVHNTGAAPAVIQLEVMKWSQQDGKDVFVPTRDVLATPPIFTVPPQGRQVIRVGLRAKPDAQTELSYRLFLREVPPAPEPGLQGLQIALHMSLPVFITPTVAAKPALSWQAHQEKDGQLRVEARNSGNAHVQITQLRLAQADGSEVASKSMLEYLLPGQAKSWLLTPSRRAAGPLQLRAQTDAGALQSDLVAD